MDAALRDSGQEESAQLLQMKAAPRRAPPAGLAAQSEELQKTLPIGYLHVPKTGITFLNTILHLPGVCPTLPENLTYCPDDVPQEGCVWRKVLEDDYGVPDSCPGLLDLRIGHDGFKGRYHFAELRGNYMTMLRDPEQRTLSAWYYLQERSRVEDWDTLAADWRAWGGLPDRRIPNITEFAAGYAGCATKMLTREGHPCGDRRPPTAAEVQEAKERLHTDLSFIGLTDEWALSMCLLSAQFKVPCLPVMMGDARRPDETVDTEAYDVAVLQGIRDPYDREIYEEGTKIFRERLERYNVTEERCRQTCWKDAGLE